METPAPNTDAAIAPPPTDDPLIGVVLAQRYRIDRCLGRGTTGAVYHAAHVKFGRSFAVKVLTASRSLDEKLVRRFVREAELAGSVRHPNVISVVDVGETDDGSQYMVMELASGVDLATVLHDEAPLAGPRALKLLRGLCEGLHHAHEHAVIHRDLKPENVIIERDDHGDEVPRIVDFGIAIARDEASMPGGPERLTTGGLVLGTPHYMAPEQATAQPMDHRIDLFALGVIAYEMLSGRLPFAGSGAEVARANLMTPTPPMSERAPTAVVDPLLEAFTRQLMAKEMNARPPTAKAARDLLDLIDSDRAAAAAALGVPVEQVVGDASARLEPHLRSEATTEPPRTRTANFTYLLSPATAAVVAEDPNASAIAGGATAAETPAMLPAVGSAIIVQPSPIAAPAPPPVAGRTRTQSGRIAEVNHYSWGKIAAALVISCVVAGVGVWMVLRSSEPARSRGGGEASAAVVMTTEPADAAAGVATAAASESRDAAVWVIADAAEAAVAVDEAPAIAVAEPHSSHAVALPVPPPPRHVQIAQTLATKGVAPSPAELAAQYSQLGKQLKQLADRRGGDATDPLWARYRRIRIAEALATDAGRKDAAVEFAGLRRDIARAQ